MLQPASCKGRKKTRPQAKLRARARHAVVTQRHAACAQKLEAMHLLNKNPLPSMWFGVGTRFGIEPPVLVGKGETNPYPPNRQSKTTNKGYLKHQWTSFCRTTKNDVESRTWTWAEEKACSSSSPTLFRGSSCLCTDSMCPGTRTLWTDL